MTPYALRSKLTNLIFTREKKNDDITPINKMCEDNIRHLSVFLTPNEIKTLSLTSQYFNNTLKDNSVWKPFLKNHHQIRLNSQLLGQAKILFQNPKNRIDIYIPIDAQGLEYLREVGLNPETEDLIPYIKSNIISIDEAIKTDNIYKTLALKGNLIKENDIHIIEIYGENTSNTLFTKHGYRALREKLITPSDIIDILFEGIDNILPYLFSKNGIIVLQEKLLLPIHMKKIIQLADSDGLIQVLEDNSILMLREKLLVPEDLISIVEAGGAIALHSTCCEEGAFMALKEKLVTTEQIIRMLKASDPNVLNFLFSKDGLKNLRNKFFDAEQVIDILLVYNSSHPLGYLLRNNRLDRIRKNNLTAEHLIAILPTIPADSMHLLEHY